MLTNDQLDFYHENGYLLVPDVFGEEELAALRSTTDSFLARGATLNEPDSIFDIAPGDTPSQSRVRRIKDPQLHSPVYDRTMRHPKLIGIVQQLIGEDVRLDSAKVNFKPVGGGAPIDWHQDWAAFPYTNDDILTVGVYLEDCGEENGPLMVIPKSHKGPVYSHHDGDTYVMAVNPEDFKDSCDDPVPLPGKAGSITIHHVRTLHASLENTGRKARRLLLFSYAAVDAWPLVPNLDWEEFNNRIIVGEPTFRPRMEKLPLEMPVPMAEDTTIYLEQAKLRQRRMGIA